MTIPRLRPLSSLLRPQVPSPSSLTPFLTPIFARNAAHATESRANKAKQGPGKRLGAKKGASELVVPGNIIFRQRGTKWFPGENCDLGRDHTIFATAKGYVIYYRDPERHPDRKYIGVVFERGMKLPLPRNAARRRKLGMETREMSTSISPQAEDTQDKDVVADLAVIEGKGTHVRDQPREVRQDVPAKKEAVKMRPGYMFRETNAYIGRAADRAGIIVKKYDKRDRFAAWRKRTAKIKEQRENRVMRGNKKQKRA